MLGIFLGFSLFFIYFYFYIDEVEKSVFTKIEANSIQQISYMLENIEAEIVEIIDYSESKDIVEIFNSDALQKIYESKLSQLLTPNIKYIYFLYQDSKGRFRFLLDGSHEDKANFYQKFDVENQALYKKLYKYKEPQIIRQINMENLWLTYLYPVEYNGKVIGLLNVDMTTNLQHTIMSFISPIKNFFVVLIVFVFLLMVTTVVQIFRYFLTRRRLFSDQLTGLYNRNYLEEIIPNLNLYYYSIAVLDLDHFKMINDTYGHRVGDQVLRESALLLSQSIRESDTLIRYGGEEFLLFIYKRDFTDGEVQHMCERIRQKVEDYIVTYENIDVNITVSIGVHEHPHLEKSLNEAIRLSDSMLYVAKRRGRNQVVIYNEKQQDSSHISQDAITIVKTALEEERVLCHYQPIYNPHNGKILKYEALVRIIDDNDELIYPGVFLPLLKHTNVYNKLTKRILNICFEYFMHNSHHVSINLSFLDLMNDDILEFILENLNKNSELASRVTFEILESDEIEDIATFKDKIKILHDIGVKVAIDDFGSGYSNFKAILDIEADYLKIDGTLIQDIDKSDKVFKVVKNIILFAKESQMRTIAEFVSSKELYDKLIELDVDYMQGFYIAKPSAELMETIDL